MIQNGGDFLCQLFGYVKSAYRRCWSDILIAIAFTVRLFSHLIYYLFVERWWYRLYRWLYRWCQYLKINCYLIISVNDRSHTWNSITRPISCIEKATKKYISVGIYMGSNFHWLEAINYSKLVIMGKYIDSMLIRCWPIICDVGLAVNQHWLNAYLFWWDKLVVKIQNHVIGLLARRGIFMFKVLLIKLMWRKIDVICEIYVQTYSSV